MAVYNNPDKFLRIRNQNPQLTVCILDSWVAHGGNPIVISRSKYLLSTIYYYHHTSAYGSRSFSKGLPCDHHSPDFWHGRPASLDLVPRSSKHSSYLNVALHRNSHGYPSFAW